jgi:hypothetical protein
VKFRSTLERYLEQAEESLKKAKEKGYSSKPVDEVFEMITSSAQAEDLMRVRSIMIAKTIQPSITESDLKMASDMMCALASELVLNLMREGLISLNKKEA